MAHLYMYYLHKAWGTLLTARISKARDRPLYGNDALYIEIIQKRTSDKDNEAIQDR